MDKPGPFASQPDTNNTRPPEIDCEDLAKVHENANLTDGRARGEYKSSYPLSAWRQIFLEFSYLGALLFGLALCLIDPALSKSPIENNDAIYTSYFLQLEVKGEALKWIALTISGMLGGTIFCLKWLYHSVAKGAWHSDRVLWRIVVPFNSAFVALFTGFLFASGTVPFLKDETLDTPIMAASFGFIFGYFSDNILAALQNFAHKIFGTLGKE
ncbi:hypothetical protein [Cereibacter changlensis]|uniref:hypothetical protein n=1 Tax=Cereibacter changlensis TaxID=402884 RepID=UPI0040333B54